MRSRFCIEERYSVVGACILLRPSEYMATLTPGAYVSCCLYRARTYRCDNHWSFACLPLQYCVIAAAILRLEARQTNDGPA